MTNKKPLGEVVYHYCHNLGHVSRNCRKLQNKNRRFQSIYYHKSLKSASTSIATLAESSKTSTCFLSSSSIWVIDSRATTTWQVMPIYSYVSVSPFYLYCYPCRWVNILCSWVRNNSSNSSNHFDLCSEFTIIIF